MLKNITIGKYIPGNTVLHRLNARTKIIISFVFTILIFFSKSIFVLNFILLLGLFLMKLIGASILRFFKSNIFILSFPLVAAVLNTILAGRISEKILLSTAISLIKILSLIFTSSWIMFTTSPNELSYSMEKILKPLDYIGLNSRDISLTITITLRFFPTIFEEASRIISTQKRRGATFRNKSFSKNLKSVFSILIPLFVSSIKKADDLAVALESRCYESGKKRTYFKNSKFKKEDYIAFFILGILTLGVIICTQALKII